ncbi:MAG: hypothetical protein M3Y06_11405, partial [Actinomycetota bacterium]|nr:hypothetical protein [Actinomycetota bacterium]
MGAGALGVPVLDGVPDRPLLGPVVVGVAVVVTAGAVCVTVGVVKTTEGVIVIVTVGALGWGPRFAGLTPNRVVPEPESPRTRSVT